MTSAKIEAKVRLRLDTQQATQQLREFEKESGGIAKRFGSLGSNLGQGFTLGAAAGAGFRLASRLSSGTIGDIFSEATSGIRADWDLTLGGQRARAESSAREQTKQAYASVVAETGNTDEVKRYYNNILPLHRRAEQGGALIDQALGGGRADDAKEGGVLEKLIEAILGGISDGFQFIITALTGIGSGR